MLTILRFAVETRSETNILPPGFTSYKSQLQYQVYDVTEMLSGEFPSGDSTLIAVVSGGWAVGSFVFTRVNLL